MDDAEPESTAGDAAGSVTAARDAAGAERAGRLRSFRSGAASVLWLLAVVAALVLAAGCLVIALEVDPDNGAVSLLTDGADRLNVLGDLTRFEGDGSGESEHDALVRTLLVSWSTAALAYLVVGKVLDRLIRP